MRSRNTRGRSPTIAAALLIAAATLASACGGSSRDGGGPDGATIQFATAGGSLAEGAGSLQVAVELSTPEPLVEALSFVLSDAGLGNAIPGSDYQTIGTRNLSFPPGSRDGSRVLVAFNPLNDALVEGLDETAVLRLHDPVGGTLGSRTSFTATVIDSDRARIGFTTATTSSIDEHTGARAIVLELDLDPGVRLGLDVDVRVSDRRTGSATAGSDYATLPVLRIPFPHDSPDGMVRSIAVQVLDDDEPEGAETVRLALEAPSIGVILGPESEHQLIIQDDDVPGISTLSLSAGAPGSEVPLPYGQRIDLGSRRLGTGPGPELVVRARNSGALPLNLGLPTLSGDARGDFSVTLAGSATTREARERIASPDRALPFVVVPGDAGPGIALRHDASRAPDLQELTAVTLHDFPIPDLGPVALALTRVPLPIAPGALVVLDGRPIEGGLRALVGEIELWGGTIVGLEGSRVFLSRRGRTLEGRIELPFGERRLVHVVADRAHGPEVDARVLRLVDDGPGGWPGGGDFCHSPVERPGRTLAPGDLDPGTEPLPLILAGCRLAVETDHQLFLRLGSTSALASYVVGLVAAIGERFATDVGARFTIAYLGLHTSADDGWTTPETGTTAAQLLSEFKLAWDPGWPVAADLAHFLSGAPLDGGAAFANSLCDQRFGYAASADLRGNLDWSTWTGESSSQTWDFVVTAHELGHNFGSLHTHDYCPPLDRCADSCAPGTQCGLGTLMSYCHLCSGGLSNIQLVFHPFTANVMRQAVNTSCLPPAALEPGEVQLYSLRFAPISQTGILEALLRLPHEATNEPRPFELRLRGQSLP